MAKVFPSKTILGKVFQPFLAVLLILQVVPQVLAYFFSAKKPLATLTPDLVDSVVWLVAPIPLPSRHSTVKVEHPSDGRERAAPPRPK